MIRWDSKGRAGWYLQLSPCERKAFFINYRKLYSTTLSKTVQITKVPPEEDQEAFTCECFQMMVIPKGHRQCGRG